MRRLRVTYSDLDQQTTQELELQAGMLCSSYSQSDSMDKTVELLCRMFNLELGMSLPPKYKLFTKDGSRTATLTVEDG